MNSYDVQVLKDLALHSMFFETIAKQVKENEDAFLYTIMALARAAEMNDEDTGNHLIRVNEYAYELAMELGLSEKTAMKSATPPRCTMSANSIFRRRYSGNRASYLAEEWEITKKAPSLFG